MLAVIVPLPTMSQAGWLRAEAPQRPVLFINPLSGGGIVNAMKSGRLAAETTVAALRSGNTSARALESYYARWMRLLGDDHVRFYRVKEALARFDDAFYDNLARTVNRIPEKRRTLRRIFGEALVRHPTLLPVVAKYFA